MPFAADDLLKTDYRKVAKLLNDQGMPCGKVWQNAAVVVIKLNAKGKETVLSKISEGA
jgi:hypothetical protein